MLDRLPAEVKEIPSWVVWRMENVDGRRTKVPYNPLNGKRASSMDPSNWVSFADAVAAFESMPGTFTGLGFMLSDRDPFTIIDLDDPFKDEKCDPATAAEIMARFQRMIAAADTYVELSPSGNGVHIFLRGKLEGKGMRADKDKIEVYSRWRFMTMTGQPVSDKPIADGTEFLKGVKVFIDSRRAVKPISGPGGDLSGEPMVKSDEQIKAEIFSGANIDTVRMLWTPDAWRARYESQSSADLAMLNIIAHRTKNRDQIARIFLESPLGMRDKASRHDYLSSSIDMAMSLNYQKEQMMAEQVARIRAMMAK